MAEESNHNQVIPPELVFEILRRLPVKSLCRFKCVSTLWCAIISDSGFTSSLWLHRRSRPRLLVALPHCGGDKSKDYWLQLHAHGAGASSKRPRRHGISSLSSMLTDLGATPHFKLHVGQRGVPQFSRSVGGLVCHQLRDHIRICNPSTGQHVEYPSVRAQAQHPEDYGGQWTCLCLDPVTNQHKVLQSIANTRLGVFENHVMIFFSKDRSWRRIRDTPITSMSLDGDGVCLNGVLYYRVRARSGGRYLMKFHVHEERFELGSGNLDRRLDTPGGCQSKLVEFFNGRLAVVDFPGIIEKHNGNRFQLWLLDHEGFTHHMQPLSVVLPSKEILPWGSRLNLLGSIQAGKVLVFMSTVESSSESRCLFYNAKRNIFSFKKGVPTLGGCPAYRPMINLLSVSDHEENLMVLEN